MKKIVVKILSVIVIMAVCVACGDGAGGSDRMRMTVEGSGEVSFYLSGSGTVTIDWGDGSDRTVRELERGASPRFSKVYAPGSHTITIKGSGITGLTWQGSIIITDRRDDIALTSLDVRRNPKLTSLTVCNAQLTSLDVSRNTALTNLYVRQNQLTSLDLSRNTALRYLTVSQNQLASLDLRQNLELRRVLVYKNQLTSLNVSRYAVGLIHLSADNNQLATFALNALFESLPEFNFLLTPDISCVFNGTIFIHGNPGTSGADRSIATAKGWSFNQRRF